MGCSSSKELQDAALAAGTAAAADQGFEKPEGMPDKIPENALDLVDRDSHAFKITIVGAKSLPPSDANGLADPFAYFKWRDVLKKTAVEYKNLNPTWNAEFDDLKFNPTKDSTVITFRVLDYDKTSWDDAAGDTKLSDPLGSCDVDIKDVLDAATESELTVSKTQKLNVANGELELSITVAKLSALDQAASASANVSGVAV
eukprot:GHVN01098445.1.p1 GENE.GHVN01098445.1~~GHVN01098445.1.p1  ORF type:complete len:201 (-),score=31.51 GHVN01098445.1:248-850(-)